jgi:hypothetical protein
MRPVAVLVACLLVVTAGCGGGTAPSSGPSATEAPSPSPVASAPGVPSATAGAPTPEPSAVQPGETLTVPTELVLGQTFGLIYDPLLERVVLVNGALENAAPRPTELWSWDGSAWELVDASGPVARSFGSVARDPVRGTIVVHGGLTADGDPIDETLEWDGRDWTAYPWSEEGPGAREGSGMAWDEAGERLLLFGGSVGMELRGDTWAWDGTEWTEVAAIGPQARFVSLMTDTRLGGILLQGGHWVDGNDGGFLADTWFWNGSVWAEVSVDTGPGQRVNGPGTWDANHGGVVLFGGGTDETGQPADDTWLWDGAWSEIARETAPTARNGHALAFDERRGVLVLVGGLDRPGGRQVLDVWELDGDGWRQVESGAES